MSIDGLDDSSDDGDEDEALVVAPASSTPQRVAAACRDCIITLINDGRVGDCAAAPARFLDVVNAIDCRTRGLTPKPIQVPARLPQHNHPVSHGRYQACNE